MLNTRSTLGGGKTKSHKDKSREMKIDKRVKLSPATVRAIRRRYARRGNHRITQAALANRYHVDPSTINQIVLGRSRRYISGPRSTSGGDDTATRAHGKYNGRVKLTELDIRKIRALYAAQQPRIT